MSLPRLSIELIDKRLYDSLPVNGLGTDRTGQRRGGYSLKATLPRGSGTHLIHFPSTNKPSIVVTHIAELLEPTPTATKELSTRTRCGLGNVGLLQRQLCSFDFRLSN